MTVKLFTTAELLEKSGQLYSDLESLIRRLLPSAKIEHIGSTAVPGSITKGDVDVLVQVSESEFEAAETLLAGSFDRNHGSAATETFASFQGEQNSGDFGIQLCTLNNKEYNFLEWRDALLASPELLESYNNLKRASCKGSMSDYRKAKSDFIELTISTAT